MKTEPIVVIEKGTYYLAWQNGLARIKKEYIDPSSKEKILEGDARQYNSIYWETCRWNSQGVVICGNNSFNIGKPFIASIDTLTDEFMEIKRKLLSCEDYERSLASRLCSLEDWRYKKEQPSWLKKLLPKFRKKR